MGALVYATQILCDQDAMSKHRRVDERFVDGAMEFKDVFLSIGERDANENFECLPTGRLALPTVGSMKLFKAA
jgi:hypothetical protein